jgi:FkbM family methyltransferase
VAFALVLPPGAIAEKVQSRHEGVPVSLRTIAKRLIALTPYRIQRGAPNRFDAIAHFIRHIATRGYGPRCIIDGGAHVGDFARGARAAFPHSEIHMVEPQPACAVRLRTLASQPGFHFHPVALTAERTIVRMNCAEGPDTGAHIVSAGNPEQATLEVQGETLDALFAGGRTREDRTFLKLDLQGHELSALKGASLLLQHVELVLTEVSFFTQLDECTISQLMSLLDQAGFDLFDVVSVAGRRRDDRARQGDFVFVRRQTPLWADKSWA